jgi:hypothetical protein
MRKHLHLALYVLCCYVLCGCSFSGEATAPADWPGQLAAARSAAREIDTEAVLTFIGSDPIGLQDATLRRIWFQFLRPDGQFIEVDLTRSGEGYAVTTDMSSSRGTALSEAEFDQLGEAEQRVLPLLKLGPLEALQLVYDRESAGARQDRGFAHATLSIDPANTELQERFAVPSVWVVLRTVANDEATKATRAFIIHPGDGTLLEEKDAF